MIFNATVSGSSSSMLSATPTVFVVDAEPAVGKSLEPLIRGAGWRTKDFASAEEFVTLPRMRVPSCLVLEIYPPGLSNPELQRLVGDRMDMPVILLSCHSDAPMIVQAMKAGAFDYFIKPFDLQALIHYSAKDHTGVLTGTLKERAGAPAALIGQINDIAQLRGRDPQGRVPVDLELAL